MSRHGGAKRHGCRVFVTHLADQDDVRILAHEAANTVAEIQAHRLAHRRLADHLDGVLHRILQGHDVYLLGIQVIEHGVQRRGLTAAGGPGDENDALGPRHHQAQGVQRIVIEAQAIQGHDTFLAIEHTKHDVLAVIGWQRRYTEVYRTARHRQGDTAILGRTHLGDVHARHHFHAHRDCRPVISMQAANLA